MQTSQAAHIAVRNGNTTLAAEIYRDLASHAKICRQRGKADFYTKLADEYGAMKVSDNANLYR